MSKYLLLLSAISILGGCAYVAEGSVQEVEIRTPGANNAECNVFVKGLKHPVNPPAKVNLLNSHEILVVDCKAPGNRRQVVHIKPGLANAGYLNVSNAGAGFVWDHLSGAMYKYPPVIEVNFENTPVKPQPLPAQNNPDIRQPEDYPLEEFMPGAPKLNDDKYRQDTEIRRRQTSGFGMDDAAMAPDPFSEPTSGQFGGKGLDDQASMPVPLIPGQ